MCAIFSVAINQGSYLPSTLDEAQELLIGIEYAHVKVVFADLRVFIYYLLTSTTLKQEPK